MIFRFASVALVALYLVLPMAASASSSRHVDVLRLKADINPVTAAYIARGIAMANADGASAAVIELDTPGGDLASMTSMIQHMDASRVPTIVYVYPDGAWAGSAGTFITVAADVAAMAPGTSIGAASPVGSGGSDLGKTEQRKVTNFSAAYIATQAQDHGHSAKFAKAAVRSAKAITYRQALSEHVVDFVAPSLPALLARVDGYVATTPTGPVRFHTAGASLRYVDMDWSEQFLLLISDPNLVLILLSVGTLAIIFELSSPGAILPGVVGVLCLAIAFFAMGVLPINAAGLVLMAFGILLFIADVKMPTHGILTVGGIIAFALGSILLFSPGNGAGPSLSPLVVVFVTAIMASFFGFIVTKAIRAKRWPITTGIEAMIGQIAVAQTILSPAGTVYVDGALWNAVMSPDLPAVPAGTPLMVTGMSGLTLDVQPVSGRVRLTAAGRGSSRLETERPMPAIPSVRTAQPVLGQPQTQSSDPSASQNQPDGSARKGEESL